mmetsp:Transcript_32057/g.55301  ORF Transcript_32057/g.55301 Transcript_32057/m.55301 type:complete len:189 (-) Transcript_32057:765-1331(-)
MMDSWLSHRSKDGPLHILQMETSQLMKLTGSHSLGDIRLRSFKFRRVPRTHDNSRQGTPYDSVDKLFDRSHLYTKTFDVSHYPLRTNMKGTPKRPVRSQSTIKLRRSPESKKKSFVTSLVSSATYVRQSLREKIMQKALEVPLKVDYSGPVIALHTPARKISLGNDTHTRESNPGYSRKPSDGGFYLH